MVTITSQPTANFYTSRRTLAGRLRFYVGISRAKESVTIFTDDAATLQKRVQDTHTRKAALELDGLRDELKKHGLFRVEPKREEVKQPQRREQTARMGRTLRAMHT